FEGVEAPRTALALLLFLTPAIALAGPTTHDPGTPQKPAAKPSAGATLIRTAASHRTAHIGTPTPPHKAKPAQSVGSPTQGHLIGGAHLDESTYLRIVPFYKGSDARWGLDALVGLVDRAGQRVHKQYSDAVLSVGHLSKRG